MQFTGGRDSTITVIKLIEEFKFDEIHLISFKTDLMTNIDCFSVNAQRLKTFFKDIRFIFLIIDTQDLLIELFNKNYFQKLRKYGTFHISTFCAACRLSHHAHSIVYCIKNDISYIADGVNKLTGFDLFQQPWCVAKVKDFYQKYDISYLTPIYLNPTPSECLLEEYNKKNKVEKPFSDSQPVCLGGGQFHNLFLRCFYLPFKGKKKYIDVTLKWIEDYFPAADFHIQAHLNLKN